MFPAFIPDSEIWCTGVFWGFGALCARPLSSKILWTGTQPTIKDDLKPAVFQDLYSILSRPVRKLKDLWTLTLNQSTEKSWKPN
ncbi:unnamed protein product [Ambrosiozyma monospora]|uniref:Unnamed protein product n=1 Tax=Ambrosiozyma monospora TaxID=43982 RepID=A0ACB5T4N1_AMBMO|nr:unnamed protein product [Ambrosiozyma monospora]